MRKLNHFIQLLSVATLLLLGHPDTALAQIVFSPTNTVALNLGGPGQTASSTVTVTSSTGATATNVAVSFVSTQDGTNWLCPTVSGNIISIAIGSGCGTSTTQLLANTTYNGHFNVTSDQGTNSVSVSVQVGGTGATTGGLSTIPSALTFTQSVAGQSVGSQVATVYFNGGTTNVTSVSFIPSSGPGGAITFANCFSSGATVTCNLTGSASTQGTYTGTATITTATGGTIGLPITLTIGTTGLSVSQNPVILTAASPGAAVNPQFVTVNYNGQQVTPSSVSYTTQTGGSWLQAFVSGNQIEVTASSFNLGIGTYSGTVTVNSFQYGSTSFQVNLNIGTSAGLSVTPNPVTLFAASTGAAVTTQYATVLYNGGQVTPSSVSYTTSTGGSWLQAYVSGNSVAVSGFSSSLGIGTYTGTVTVNTSFNGSTSFSVTLTVGINVTTGLSASPSPVTFNASATGATVLSQIVSITYNGSPASIIGISTTTSTGQNWLVASSNGTAVNVSANTGSLATGVYTGTVTVSTTFGSTTFQVNLTVGTGVQATSALSVSPPSLQPFSFQIGGSNPAAQAISVYVASPLGIPTSTAVSFSASATTSSGGSWLSVTPTAGTTPATVSVGVNPSSLAAGTYSGMVTISALGTSNSPAAFCGVIPPIPSCPPPVSLPVTLTVTRLMLPPTVTSVQNAASSASTSLSPGLNIVIYGSNMGPATLAGLQLGSSGAAATLVAGTQVTFDGTPAPIIYTKSTQVSVMVPYEVAGKATTSMVVSYNGASSTPLPLNVANTAPGIYTLNQTGTGQGAILNQDGTLNGPQNPEMAGHIIQIYLTGEGQTTPPGVDGAITPGRLPVPTPIASVQVTIGGVPVSSSKITFYGEAPGVISGVMQVDAEVPPGAGTGSIPVIVTVGGVNSQPNVTVSLR